MTQLKPVDQKPSTWQRTTLLATDNSHSIIGEIVDGKHNSIAYTAYGEQSSQQEDRTRLSFNGQLREAKIGWYLLGNGYRAYNPRLMRFHSPDSWSPFGGGGLNAYMYCVGDPVNHSDPTGHMLDLIVFGLSQVKKNVHLPGYRAKALGAPLPGKQISEALWGFHETKMNIVASEVRPSSSAGLALAIGTLGTSHKKVGGSPAISDIGRTTEKSHLGYAGAAAGGFTLLNRPGAPLGQHGGRAMNSNTSINRARVGDTWTSDGGVHGQNVNFARMKGGGGSSSAGPDLRPHTSPPIFNPIHTQYRPAGNNTFSSGWVEDTSSIGYRNIQIRSQQQRYPTVNNPNGPASSSSAIRRYSR